MGSRVSKSRGGGSSSAAASAVVADRIGGGGDWSVIPIERLIGSRKSPSDVTRLVRGEVDPSELEGLPGQVGEQFVFRGAGTPKDRTDRQWNELKASLRSEGMKDPVVISKTDAGVVFVQEGNHRIRAAIQIGMRKIPVEIRYKGGSENLGALSFDKS